MHLKQLIYQDLAFGKLQKDSFSISLLYHSTEEYPHNMQVVILKVTGNKLVVYLWWVQEWEETFITLSEKVKAIPLHSLIQMKYWLLAKNKKNNLFFFNYNEEERKKILMFNTIYIMKNGNER